MLTKVALFAQLSVGGLAEFLLEVSRTSQDAGKRLQLLSDVSARLLSALRHCSVETDPNTRDSLLAALEDILTDRSQFLQDLGSPDKADLLEEALHACTRAPTDKRSARCWLTYITDRCANSATLEC
jgi:hypothetical protein